MALPPVSDHAITLDEARALTARYRASAADPVRALLFHREPVAALLGQAGCHGVRMYFGRDDDNALHLVLVGVNGRGEDLTAGMLLQEGWPCPPYCSMMSALNQRPSDHVAVAA